MMGHTHFTFGALFAGIAITQGYAEPTVAFFLGSQIGSLFPDLDHPQAMLSKKVPMSGMTIGLLKHRTLTHSIVGLAIAYAIGKYLVPPLLDSIWALLLSSFPDYSETLVLLHDKAGSFLGTGFLWGFVLGYISHIVIDLFNPMGVQLFYPFDFMPNKGWVHPPFGWGIRTGSIWELVFTLVSLAAAILIEPMIGGITAIVVVFFWYLIGKPGFPRYKL